MESGEERDGRLEILRIEDPVENRLDQQRGHGLGRADYGHQEDGDEQMGDVGAGVAEQAGGLALRRAFSRLRSLWSRLCRDSTAVSTSVAEMSLIEGAVSTCDSVRQGAHVTGSDGP